MLNPSTKEFQEISKLLYERNVDLLYVNKELSLLQKLYQIIITSYDLSTAAQASVDTIAAELNSVSTTIFLQNKSKTKLSVTATSKGEFEKQFYLIKKKSLNSISIDLNNQDNSLQQTFVNKQKKIAHSLSSVFQPFLTHQEASEIQSQSKVRSILLFPLIFNSENLGVLMIMFNHSTTQLSSYERKAIKQIPQLVSLALNRIIVLQNLRHTSKKLSAANRQLKQLDKLKDEFISIASHELRTPMTALRGYIWMAFTKMDEHPELFPAKIREYVGRSLTSAEHLIDLTNDMLEVSRIEGKRLELKPLYFDILSLINEIKSEFTSQALEKNQKIITKFPSDQELLVFADPNKIQQVISNLVSNALKYSPAKTTVLVDVHTLPSQIKISVTDSGSGIAPEDIPKLFKKFNRLQVSLSNQAQIPGTGLGLYISKEIVNLSGGEIGVESSKKGSTFFFTLPHHGQNNIEKK